MADEPTAGFFSPLLARPGALLALWALPTLAIALLTALLGPPALGAVRHPTPPEALAQLAGLAAVLWPELFLLAWLAAPTAALVEGKGPREALGSAVRGAVLGTAAMMAVMLTLALLLTMLPGLMAAYVNPLMGLIFLVTGTIGGAAAAVGLFARWMYAPALAADGRGAGHALDGSRAMTRRERNFGPALGLAIAFVLVLGLSAAAGIAGERVAGFAGKVLGAWLPLWLGTALVEARVAQRWRTSASGPVGQPGPPVLALTRRPSRCPRCGALATVGVTGPAAAECPGCGLRATVQ